VLYRSKLCCAFPVSSQLSGSESTLSNSITIQLRQGREADHSPPSNAEIKAAWSHTSTPPIHLHVMVTTLLSPFRIPCFFGTQAFITVDIQSSHLTVSWISSLQFAFIQNFLSAIHFNIMVSAITFSINYFYPWGFTEQNFVDVSCFSLPLYISTDTSHLIYHHLF
jgi:hypothetical protein